MLRTKQLIRVVVAAKILLLIGIWISYDDSIYFGDRASVAQPQEEQTPPITKDEPEKPRPTLKARKSFLANLLELPALDPERVKKEELGRYLEIAERKKQQVEERISLLQRRESQLRNLETSIDDKLRRLDEERQFFAQTMQREKDLKGERIVKLVDLYKKMEPKKAGPVLEKMDKDLVVELFKQIPQKQVTRFLETMAPEKSVELSEYFGRVRSAREYDLLKEVNTSLLKEFEDCKGMP